MRIAPSDLSQKRRTALRLADPRLEQEGRTSKVESPEGEQVEKSPFATILPFMQTRALSP